MSKKITKGETPAAKPPASDDEKDDYVFFGTEDCERLTVTGSKWLEDTLRIACRRL